MQILFVLIPLSILLLTIAVLIFRWAVKSGQYDDLKGPAHSILFDDDKHMVPTDKPSTDPSADDSTPDLPPDSLSPGTESPDSNETPSDRQEKSS
ncbi:cbb3-type cytochrome oxidase assembly protein CcoS [Hahella ganghwensis]|uniref:cbb3-type cytochrome oxidase assembly protein CcoS n=1 Tax=Hahella ganghwensis TaxID=286420 RepID=UPI0003635F42|nr:cbb3-type cytochrome oxidase assembly protein CcoS [Hahella ganghwensis]